MEVEEMIHKLREEHGRLFDVRELTTSCVANVMMNMMFGYRFQHSDPDFRQLLSNVHELSSNYSMALQLFPVLRFLPYFKRYLAHQRRTIQDVFSFISNNIATSTQVRSVILTSDHIKVECIGVAQSILKSKIFCPKIM